LLDDLERLSQIKNTKICIVSGRTKESLDSWFNGMNIDLYAEHGAWSKIDGKWILQETAFDNHKQDLLKVMQKYAKRTSGAMVEEKSNSVVWHFRKVNPELAYARNANLLSELKKITAGTDIEVYSGNKIIEVKPKDSNKGMIVSKLIEVNQPEFILAAGDDFTDEDMFTALPEQAISIKVGNGETSALFKVKDVEGVLELIKLLASKK
jgi:trehalose 6-phosphate synthase/phosphatase